MTYFTGSCQDMCCVHTKFSYKVFLVYLFYVLHEGGYSDPHSISIFLTWAIEGYFQEPDTISRASAVILDIGCLQFCWASCDYLEIIRKKQIDDQKQKQTHK